MIGYEFFLKRINSLVLSEQCKLLKKIFRVDVLTFDINLINNNICIKIYDGYIYYQFVFVVSSYKDEYLNINISDRIVVCHIFANNVSQNLKLFNIEFIKFIDFLLNGDEKLFNNFS